MKQKIATMPDRNSVCFLDRYEISPEDLAAFNRQVEEEDRQLLEVRRERRLARAQAQTLAEGSR